jgi:hypothetical protein
MAYTSDFLAPEIFRKWTAYSLVAGALERKVWLNVVSVYTTYPNLYVFLVSPPGVGKTNLTSFAYQLWSELPNHHLAPTSVSRASLMDALADAVRTIVTPRGPKPQLEFNSLITCIDELGNFLHTYDQEFIAFLTGVFDNKPMSEKKRHRKSGEVLLIQSPQINFLAGCTPSYLHNIMPEGAWDQGLMSRVICIYSGEAKEIQLFTSIGNPREAEFKALVNDLKHISELFGQMAFEPEAGKEISYWVKGGQEPKPNHPRLQSYSTRRVYNLLKLCMIASVMESDKLLIEVRHFNQALELLLEAEMYMPDVFQAMSIGGTHNAIKEAYHFLYTLYMKNKEPIREAVFIHYLASKLPSHSVMGVVELMIQADMIKYENVSGVGRVFTPKAR